MFPGGGGGGGGGVQQEVLLSALRSLLIMSIPTPPPPRSISIMVAAERVSDAGSRVPIFPIFPHVIFFPF